MSACEFSPELQNQLVRQISSDIAKDNECYDLRQILNLSSHTVPTMSGDQDYDYPSVSISSSSASQSSSKLTSVGLSLNLKQLSLVKQNPIPAEILAEFSNMQASCVSGFFPQISRAWVAIDNILYIWNYFDGSDPTFYDGVSETIVSAAVVQPKAKFINNKEFKYLLVVCTAAEIFILGLNLNSLGVDNCDGFGNKTELVVHTPPLFSITTDSCIFTCITGTSNGRIFLGGKDGALHEVIYKPNEGWFSGKRCWKVNHSKSTMSYVVPLVSPFLSFSEDEPIMQIEVDDKRNVLFTRSEKGTLRLFDLGIHGNDLNRTATMSAQTIQTNAISIARNIDRSNFKQITNLCLIDPQDSQYLNLFLTTSTGVRLYFTTKSFNSAANARPFMLTLVHVRLPPGFATLSRVKPTNVHRSVHFEGTSLMCCSSDNESEVLWCISNDAYASQSPLQESHSCVDLDQLTWNITTLDSFTNDFEGVCPSSKIAQQFYQTRKKYLLLNATSTLLIEKLRPVDQLRELLLDNGGPDNDLVESFFNLLHRPIEACTMALLLASDDCSTFVHVSDWALQALCLYGAEPRFSGIRSNTDPNITGVQDFTFNPRIISTPASVSLSPRRQNAPTFGSFMYSHKFMACSLYLSRVLRLIWEYPILKETFDPTFKATSLSIRWSESLITDALRKVRYLNKVMPKIFDPLLASSTVNSTMKQFQTDRGVVAEALRLELEAVDHLRVISTKVEEMLAFLSVMVDYHIDNIIPSLSSALKQQLKDLKFRDFIDTNRTELTSMLCVALLNKLISENIKIDPLCNKLREVSPTVFSTDDAICAQANDLLQTGLKAHNSDSQDTYLYESLEMFKKVAHIVDLVQVCGYYQQVNFCEGIVELCVCAAMKKDATNIALNFYQNLKPSDDVVGREIYQSRYECYQSILNMLHYYHSIVQNGGNQPQASSKEDLNLDSQTCKDLTAFEARTFFDCVLNECLSKDDELLQIAVYLWLLDMGLHDKILENASSSLELVLSTQARTSSERDLVVILELLWKFYEKNGCYEQAAQILCTLAERRSVNVKLTQRVNFLGRALVSAKSCDSTKSKLSSTNAEIIKEIEDKLEVAQVQLKIFSAINQLKGIPPEEKEDLLSTLNSELFNLTQLYSDFASTYGLCESKLAIIVVAGHNDPTTVEFIWLELIDNIFKEALDTRMTSLLHGSSSSDVVQIEVVTTKFLHVAKEYVDRREQFFPLNAIVNHLEKRSCELKMGRNWVFQMLIDLGVVPHELLTVYIDLWNCRDKIWTVFGEKYHLLWVIDSLLRQFLTDLNASGDHERCRTSSENRSSRITFYEIASQFVTREIVSLSSNSTDPECKQLIDGLKRSMKAFERVTFT